MELAKKPKKAGFTLIELLAGMTILVVMVLFLSKLYTDATSMWRLGTKRVESNFDGRAAVDFMAREISAAIVGTNITTLRLFSDATNLNTGVSSDFLAFVTADHAPVTATGFGNYHRQTKQVIYYVDHMRTPIGSTNIPNRYRIRRSEVLNQTASGFRAYTTNNWWDRNVNPNAWFGADILAENIRTLEFIVYTTNAVGAVTNYFNYTSVSNGVPVFIDMVVELLGHDDAIRIAEMPGAPPPASSMASDMANRAARRYFQRIYLNNTHGL